MADGSEGRSESPDKIQEIAEVCGYAAHTCLPLWWTDKENLRKARFLLLRLADLEKEMAADGQDPDKSLGFKNAAVYYRARIMEVLK